MVNMDLMFQHMINSLGVAVCALFMGLLAVCVMAMVLMLCAELIRRPESDTPRRDERFSVDPDSLNYYNQVTAVADCHYWIR